MNPTPTTTTSTGFSFCAISIAFLLLHRVFVRRPYADRRAIDCYPVLIDQFVIVAERPREAEHSPADHILVPAVHRIGKVSFDRVLEQKIGEDFRRNAIESDSVRQKHLEILV